MRYINQAIINMRIAYEAPKAFPKELDLESIVCDSPFSGVEANRADYGTAAEEEW